MFIAKSERVIAADIGLTHVRETADTEQAITEPNTGDTSGALRVAANASMAYFTVYGGKHDQSWMPSSAMDTERTCPATRGEERALVHALLPLNHCPPSPSPSS